MFFVFTALRTTDVIEFFTEVIDEAYSIKDAYSTCKDTSLMARVPAVTVFLDEVNTASCLGLFKEIIVDKSIDGKVSESGFCDQLEAITTCMVALML